GAKEQQEVFLDHQPTHEQQPGLRVQKPLVSTQERIIDAIGYHSNPSRIDTELRGDERPLLVGERHDGRRAPKDKAQHQRHVGAKQEPCPARRTTGAMPVREIRMASKSCIYPYHLRCISTGHVQMNYRASIKPKELR